jgi:zona occludens toxin
MPGAGKTAAMVDYLSQVCGDRPIYVHTDPKTGEESLNGLTLPHFQCDANNWPNELPDGAILVIDEVQQVWRPRGSAAKVPESVAALETHRHHGIDVFITTQSPSLVDVNVRNLVGRHIHIRDVGVLGRHWYEWPECNTAMQWKTCVNKRRYKLPKKAFSLYKSSSLHTVPVRGIPPAIYVGGGALLAFLVLAYLIWGIVHKTAAPEPVKPASYASGSSVPVSDASAARSRATGPIDDRIDWIPRVSNRPESAPAFDHLRQVVVMPVVVGGYCQGGECRCINQQGTNAGLSSADCQRWLENPPFDPYRLPPPVATGGTDTPPAAAPVPAPKPVTS